MGVEALHAGIEFQIITTVLARLIHQPIEKPATESAGPICRPRDEIVDIKKLSRKQGFKNPVTRHSPDFASRFEISEQVTVALLTYDAFDKFFRVVEMRSQFAHDWKTTPNLLRRFGDSNV